MYPTRRLGVCLNVYRVLKPRCALWVGVGFWCIRRKEAREGRRKEERKAEREGGKEGGAQVGRQAGKLADYLLLAEA